MKASDALHDLYRADETAWLDATAELIRAGRTSELDFAHVADYLADNAVRDRGDVARALLDFLTGLLLWKHRYDQLPPSRRGEIVGHQFELENWTDTPTLRRHAETILRETYREAAARASAEAGVSPTAFPADCPWTMAELLAEEVFDR